MPTTIYAQRVYTSNGKIEAHQVIMIGDDGIITEVNNLATWQQQHPKQQFDHTFTEKYLVIPGLIETHKHGAYGYDTMFADQQRLRQMLQLLAENEGIVACYPTTMCDNLEQTTASLTSIAAAHQSQNQIRSQIGFINEAELLGCHAEGPFLDQQYPGAQKPDTIIPTNIELFRSLNQTASNLIKIMTVAIQPQHAETLFDRNNFLQFLAENHIAISIGHTSGNAKLWDEIINKLPNDAILRITHFTNAQPKPLALQKLREEDVVRRKLAKQAARNNQPTIVTKFTINESNNEQDQTFGMGVLRSQRPVFIEIIADYVHIAPEGLAWIYRQVQRNPNLKIVLVTDSIRAADPALKTKSCVTTLGPQRVIMIGGVARTWEPSKIVNQQNRNQWQHLLNPKQLESYETNQNEFQRFLDNHTEFYEDFEDLPLAGSVLSMTEAIQNMFQVIDDLGETIKMATENAAASAGLLNYGRIAVGYHGSLTVLDTEVFKPTMAFINGHAVQSTSIDRKRSHPTSKPPN